MPFCGANAIRVSTQPVLALEQIRRMRGGSQSHLMRCSDQRYYVVKFPNNPQGPRILANEMMGGRLAQLLNLPVAAARVVYVDPQLIECTEELVMEMGRLRIRCHDGLCFGSLYQGNIRHGTTENDLADWELRRVKNLNDFCGMLVFDKWTCNTDGRQVVFWRKQNHEAYRAAMIDQGFCFNAEEWNFPDSPLRGLYCRSAVYERVRSIQAFEPWLSRVEQIKRDELFAVVDGIPRSWYETYRDAVEDLLDRLYKRRMRVRELLHSAKESSRLPFPNWTTDRTPDD